jgi:hypothetical protein
VNQTSEQKRPRGQGYQTEEQAMGELAELVRAMIRKKCQAMEGEGCAESPSFLYVIRRHCSTVESCL